ncbi:MAG: serine/threonine protein kinase [Planctomycetia bacterium]|nr:serine/threonine protein kinase [Planctomycetia bacterium]
MTSVETIGSYDLVEKIAEGSMGTVYKARHWETKDIVAIKIISKEIAKNPVLIKRFEQEFRIASKLEHPNVVRAIEYCGTGATPFLVMEFVDGESLGDKLERVGKVPEEEALTTIIQVAHGLHRAHRQGLIHRDVKPDNILVNREGKAKLTDLGLAKDVDASMDLTRTGRGLGTPNFMAPEQFRNAKNASIRCDVYSLGATLYQMVTGELPFGVADPVQAMMRKLKNELPPPRQLNPQLSERVDWAIRRAMSADPQKRPGSCREFVEDLTGQSTRPDSESYFEAHDEDMWYVVYADGEGMARTHAGTTQSLREQLLQGQFGAVSAVKGSRSKIGPFEPLDTYPEFRDLLVEPAPGPPLSETSTANLAKLGRLQQAATHSAAAGGKVQPRPSAPPTVKQPAPQAPAAPDMPHFQIAAAPPSSSRKDRLLDLLRNLVIVLLTMMATLLAVRYLLPYLQ